MPVLTVTAAPLDSPHAEIAALSRLCAAVASALGLRPADVYAARVTAQLAVLGDEPVAPWPVIVLHGRRRPGQAMADAAEAARRAAADIWQRPADEVWVQWAVADP